MVAEYHDPPKGVTARSPGHKPQAAVTFSSNPHSCAGGGSDGRKVPRTPRRRQHTILRDRQYKQGARSRAQQLMQAFMVWYCSHSLPAPKTVAQRLSILSSSAAVNCLPCPQRPGNRLRSAIRRGLPQNEQLLSYHAATASMRCWNARTTQLRSAL